MNPITTTTETGATEFLANLSIGMIVLVALILTMLRLGLLQVKAATATGDGTTGAMQTIPWARAIAEILESLIIAGVLVFLIIRPFFVQAFFIPSESMEPTLAGHKAESLNKATGKPYGDTVNDHIFVNKLAYRLGSPQHGDIIVFKAPANADQSGHPPQENVLIKRLIGKPGDVIEVKQDTVEWKGQQQEASVVYRNGEKLDELSGKAGYKIMEPMDVSQPGTVAVNGPKKLGPDEYFVMGDNRNDSNDSRYWGTLTRNRIIGKASLVFFPLNRIHLLH